MTKERFRSEKQCIHQRSYVAFSTNDDKRIQSIDSVEIYAYATNKEVIHKEEIEYANIINNNNNNNKKKKKKKD